jgi:hypothetical protein
MSIYHLFFGCRLRIFGGAIGFLAANAAGALAQGQTSTDAIRHIQSIDPHSGPPGTSVSIYTNNLPLQARVVVGIGATGTGFEELSDASQDEWGEVFASVRIPESATWERPLVFIIFDGNFRPTGLSDPFHVTNAQGMVRREGRITDEGGVCAAMRDDDDYLYTLTGVVGDVQAGDEVMVVGTYAESSSCSRGNTIDVMQLETRLPQPGG